MLTFSNKRIAAFASTLSVVFILFFLTILKSEDNSSIGYAILKSPVEKASLTGLFIAIAVIIGIVVFTTIAYRQNHRY